jgi:small subunit ribosomal protein S5
MLINPTRGAQWHETRGYVSSSLPRRADDRFAPVFETPEMDREYERLAEEIKRSPKKRQRFLLTEALKGTRLKPLIAAEHELLKEEDEFKPRELQTRVIDVNRTCKVTKGGGLMNFTALVVVGNGDGVVGFATGKGKDVSLAVEKAYARASRSLVYIERFEKSTIFHAQEAKHCKTKIRLMPAKAGEGLRCNQIVESICEMAGITDLSAKVIGSHHPHNTVRACFEALERIQSPADVAAARGVTVYRI